MLEMGAEEHCGADYGRLPAAQYRYHGPCGITPCGNHAVPVHDLVPPGGRPWDPHAHFRVGVMWKAICAKLQEMTAGWDVQWVVLKQMAPLPPHHQTQSRSSAACSPPHPLQISPSRQLPVALSGAGAPCGTFRRPWSPLHGVVGAATYQV